MRSGGNVEAQKCFDLARQIEDLIADFLAEQQAATRAAVQRAFCERACVDHSCRRACLKRAPAPLLHKIPVN